MQDIRDLNKTGDVGFFCGAGFSVVFFIATIFSPLYKKVV